MKPGTKTDAELDSGFARAMGIELFYKTKPEIQKRLLLQCLKEKLPDIAPLDGKEDSKLCAFIHPKNTIKYKDGELPAQCLITGTDVAPDLKKYKSAIEQSWGFKESAEIVPACKHTVLVTDLMASGLDYKIRMQLFHKVVLAMIKALPPDAIYWQPSQQFVSPTNYAKMFEKPDENPGFQAAVNVRFYRITNQGEGDMIADTVGLGAIGLQDLQCHFKGLNPDDVIKVLYNTAYYLYDKGPVIESGHTIQGITQNQKWKCRSEASLLEPKRILLDVNPGEPNAAGNRK